MDDVHTLGRRDFLKSGAVAVAAASISCGPPNGRWRALGDAEAKTLAAACDRIVPPDDDPGATEAGAVEFIDRQLATRDRDRIGLWRAGLESLERSAVRRHGKRFCALAPARQTELLEAIERGDVEESDWPETPPRAFFATLRSYTMMSFYGDPRHGGNREEVGWRMVGLPGPPVRGRQPGTGERS